MRVMEVVYLAEDAAKLTADYIRLKLWLVNRGVDRDWTTFDGESKTMNERAWMVGHELEAGAGVEADELRVEAFDLEVDSHILLVNDHRIRIPLTGALNTRTYRFPL